MIKGSNNIIFQTQDNLDAIARSLGREHIQPDIDALLDNLITRQEMSEFLFNLGMKALEEDGVFENDLIEQMDEIANHDCTLSRDDGCSTCDKFLRGGEIHGS